MKRLKKILCLILMLFTVLMIGCTYMPAKTSDKEVTSPVGSSTEIGAIGEFESFSGYDSIGDFSSTGKMYVDGSDAIPSADVTDSVKAKEDSEYITPGYNRYYFQANDSIMSFNEIEKKAGLLTASVFFDNDNYTYWSTLVTNNQEGNDGIFKDYYDQFSFKSLNRIKLTFKDVKNAKVELLNDNGFIAYTDSKGEVYLYSSEVKESYDVVVTYTDKNNETISKEYNVKNNDIITDTTASKVTDLIQLMFVIDTTGSMGDEIDFLKLEIDDVINQVKEKNPNSVIDLALLFYRDISDEYVTRYYDFTTDIQKQKENLATEYAGGGGDFEESVETALTEAVSKDTWKENAQTKLIIHVADAPSHDFGVEKWNNSILEMAKKGIKVITVASSGINKKTEYFFRSQSLITGGAYVYITNDSGIGGNHIDATVPDKVIVEYLNALLVRLINGYYSGDFGKAVFWGGEINESEMPKEMPEDLDFTIIWGTNLSCSFNLSTNKAIIPVITEKTLKENKSNGYEFTQKEAEIILTEDELQKIYSAMRIVNLFDFPDYEVQEVTDSKDNENDRIVLTIKYGQIEKTISLSTNDEKTYLNKQLYKSLGTIISVIKSNASYLKEFRGIIINDIIVPDGTTDKKDDSDVKVIE